MIQITISPNGKWVVDKFQDVHNHDLTTTPSKVIKHRSHNKFHLSQISRTMNNVIISATEEVGITSKQCSKIIFDERKKNIGKECYNIIMHFEQKAASDPTQYFRMQLT